MNKTGTLTAKVKHYDWFKPICPNGFSIPLETGRERAGDDRNWQNVFDVK